jgi:type IX secretion system PorP/SprF family membrane protein
MKQILIKIFISLIVCSAFKMQGFSQQLNPSESQYFVNQYLANPAMAGLVNNELLVNTSYRGQWDQVPGSPQTMLFTGDYRFKGNVALGLNINSQKAGLLTQTRMMATYAYHIALGGTNENLRMGFSVGWTKAMLDYSKLVGSPNDAVVYGFNSKNSIWDIDAGVAYENNGFCIQAASANLRRILNKEYQDVSDYAMYYTSVSYKMFVNEELTINPKIAYRGVHNYDNILDVGAELIFKEPFGIYGMYHSNKSYSIGFNYLYQNQWKMFCIYNTPTKDLQGLANGAFEVGLQFRLQPKGVNK